MLRADTVSAPTSLPDRRRMYFMIPTSSRPIQLDDTPEPAPTLHTFLDDEEGQQLVQAIHDRKEPL